MTYIITSGNNEFGEKIQNAPVEIINKVEEQIGRSNIYSKVVLFFAFCHFLENGKYDYNEIYIELKALQDDDPERFKYLFFGKGR